MSREGDERALGGSARDGTTARSTVPEPMLRQNFRESSGVVVDVCAAHGIWLDRGELATLIEFASTGAMAEAERRIGERADARKRLDAFGDDLRAVGPGHYMGGPTGS
jgi:Zn-finger nucleic acid-binding protein